MTNEFRSSCLQNAKFCILDFDTSNVIVFGLTNIAPSVKSPTNNTVTICGYGPKHDGHMTAGQIIAVQCAYDVDAFRYVAVLTQYRSLTICELKVFGTGNSTVYVDPYHMLRISVNILNVIDRERVSGRV